MSGTGTGRCSVGSEVDSDMVGADTGRRSLGSEVEGCNAPTNAGRHKRNPRVHIDDVREGDRGCVRRTAAAARHPSTRSCTKAPSCEKNNVRSVREALHGSRRALSVTNPHNTRVPRPHTATAPPKPRAQHARYPFFSCIGLTVAISRPLQVP